MTSNQAPVSAADQLIELKCRNCGSQLKPEDISPQLSAARCHHCNALFALPASVSSAPIPRPEVDLPKGFEMHSAYGAIQISRRWRDAKVWFLLFFTIFWNGFLVVWHTIALSQGLWFMSLFGLIHTAVGVFLAYSVAATFINSTTIRAQSGKLQIHHGPLPWKGNLNLTTSDIEQLYCTRKVKQGKNGASTHYNLEAVLKGNKRKTLLKSLPQSDHALFLEQQIEKTLGLTDRAVEGEHGR